MAAHLETGKPMAEAQKDTAAAFSKLAKLKPNLLTVYTQMPQAFNLLEQGEAFMIASAQSSFALERKAAGAPIDIAAPREGVFPMPSGVAVVKGAPQAELAFAYVNELLGADIQGKLVGPTYSLADQQGGRAAGGIPGGAPWSTRSTGPMSRRSATAGCNAGIAKWRCDRRIDRRRTSLPSDRRVQRIGPWRPLRRFSISPPPESASALPPCSTASISASRAASSFRCSGRRDAARPRCFGSSPGC